MPHFTVRHEFESALSIDVEVDPSTFQSKVFTIYVNDEYCLSLRGLRSCVEMAEALLKAGAVEDD